MNVTRIDKDTWVKTFSEYAHKICFEEIARPEKERIDFALLVTEEDSEKPVGYVTCREWDSDTLYWQFGGAFPETKGTAKSWAAYKACVEWTRGRGYKRITTYIENGNRVMLKFAAKIGFLITGTRTFQGAVLLEHLLEFDDAIRC